MHETGPCSGLRLVKVEIEPGRLVQEAANHRRLRRDGFEICRNTLRFFSDVEPDHGDIPVGSKDGVGGMRVVPDIGFGAGGDIAVPGGASAHHHNTRRGAGDGRVKRQRRGEIRQRSDGADDDLAGRLGAGLDKIARRVAGVGHARRTHRRQGSETLRPMDEIRRRLRLAGQRDRRATCHRRWMIRHFGQAQRVAGRLLAGHISKHRRQPDDVQPRVGECHVDGHGVVNSGIGINNDFLGHLMNSSIGWRRGIRSFRRDPVWRHSHRDA